jgi:hypothetical protein
MVLDFLAFWERENACLGDNLRLHNSRPSTLQRMATTVLAAVNQPLGLYKGMLRLTDVEQPVQGGVWYSLELAKLLDSIPQATPSCQSTIAKPELHWPDARVISLRRRCNEVGTVLGVVWWAVLLVSLLQRELFSWSSNNNNDDNDDDNDDNDDDDKDDDDNSGHDGDQDLWDKAAENENVKVTDGRNGSVFMASLESQTWRAREKAEASIDVLRAVLASFANNSKGLEL